MRRGRKLAKKKWPWNKSSKHTRQANIHTSPAASKCGFKRPTLLKKNYDGICYSTTHITLGNYALRHSATQY